MTERLFMKARTAITSQRDPKHSTLVDVQGTYGTAQRSWYGLCYCLEINGH